MKNNIRNTNPHNRLVAGSNPAEPTIKANPSYNGVGSLQKVECSPDLLQLRELLHILLGSKGRGYLELRQKTNEEFFTP
jgi:hypothetical protein